MHCVPSGPKPKLSRRKELCVSNYSPSLPRACPKPPLWIVCLPKSAHVRSGIAQPCSGAVMGIARLPAAAKAEVRSYHLPWAGSCKTSTSQPEKALPTQGKCWGLGLAHQPSLPFGFNLRGKEKKQKKKEVCWSSSCLKSFAPSGAIARCWENTGKYLHPTPVLLAVQWWLGGLRLDFPSCKASHCLDLRDNFFCPSVKQLQ